MAIYISPTLLTGKTPGQITSSGKIAGLGKSGTIWYGPLEGEADFTYSTEKPGTPVEPPVEPPVVTPPPPPATPGVLAILLDTERNAINVSGASTRWPEPGAALVSDEAAFAYNSGGALGTFKDIEDTRVPTDERTGLHRLAAFFRKARNGLLNDIFMQGRLVHGFAGRRSGVWKNNMPQNGYFQIPGKFVSPELWVGDDRGIGIEQKTTLTGRMLKTDVKFKNPSSTPVTYAYLRNADPDQSSDGVPGEGTAFKTVNTVIEGGVEAKLYGGSDVYVLRTDEPGAYVCTATITTCKAPGTKRALGSAPRTADDVLQLVFPDFVIPANGEKTITFYEGLKG